MDIVINGKRVTLREHFPTRQYDDLRRQFVALGNDTPWQERAKLLQRFVKEWEFEGAPDDIESWGDLDLFDETLPLEAEIGKVIERRMTWAKNSDSGSITP